MTASRDWRDPVRRTWRGRTPCFPAASGRPHLEIDALTPSPHLLQVFISVELNSFVSQVLIARGLRRDFLQVLILKRLLELAEKADPSGHFVDARKLLIRHCDWRMTFARRGDLVMTDSWVRLGAWEEMGKDWHCIRMSGNWECGWASGINFLARVRNVSSSRKSYPPHSP